MSAFTADASASASSHSRMSKRVYPAWGKMINPVPVVYIEGAFPHAMMYTYPRAHIDGAAASYGAIADGQEAADSRKSFAQFCKLASELVASADKEKTQTVARSAVVMEPVYGSGTPRVHPLSKDEKLKNATEDSSTVSVNPVHLASAAIIAKLEEVFKLHQNIVAFRLFVFWTETFDAETLTRSYESDLGNLKKAAANAAAGGDIDEEAEDAELQRRLRQKTAPTAYTSAFERATNIRLGLPIERDGESFRIQAPARVAFQAAGHIGNAASALFTLVDCNRQQVTQKPGPQTKRAMIAHGSSAAATAMIPHMRYLEAPKSQRDADAKKAFETAVYKEKLQTNPLSFFCSEENIRDALAFYSPLCKTLSGAVRQANTFSAESLFASNSFYRLLSVYSLDEGFNGHNQITIDEIQKRDEAPRKKDSPKSPFYRFVCSQDLDSPDKKIWSFSFPAEERVWAMTREDLNRIIDGTMAPHGFPIDIDQGNRTAEQMERESVMSFRHQSLLFQARALAVQSDASLSKAMQKEAAAQAISGRSIGDPGGDDSVQTEFVRNAMQTERRLRDMQKMTESAVTLNPETLRSYKEHMRKLIAYSAAANVSPVYVPQKADISFDSIKEMNLEETLRMEEEVKIERDKNRPKSEFEVWRRKRLQELRQKMCANASRIFPGFEGRMSDASSKLRDHLRKVLKKRPVSKENHPRFDMNDHHFYKYSIKKLAGDTSNTTDVFNFVNSKLYCAFGCTRNFDIALNIFLGSIHQYLDRNMEPNILMTGRHSTGKSFLMDMSMLWMVEGSCRKLTSLSPKAMFVNGDISDCTWFLHEAPPYLFGADQGGGKGSKGISGEEAAFKDLLTSNCIRYDVLNLEDGVRRTDHIYAKANCLYVMGTNFKGRELFDKAICSRFYERDVNHPSESIANHKKPTEGFKRQATDVLQFLQSQCWWSAKAMWMKVLPDPSRVEALDIIRQILDEAKRRGAVQTEDTRHRERARMLLDAIVILRANYEHYLLAPQPSKRPHSSDDTLDIAVRMFPTKDDIILALQLVESQWTDDQAGLVMRAIHDQYFNSTTEPSHVSAWIPLKLAQSNKAVSDRILAYTDDELDILKRTGKTSLTDEDVAHLTKKHHLSRVGKGEPIAPGNSAFIATDPDRVSAHIVIDSDEKNQTQTTRTVQYIRERIKEKMINLVPEKYSSGEALETTLSEMALRRDQASAPFFEAVFPGQGSKFNVFKVQEFANTDNFELIVSRDRLRASSGRPLREAIEEVFTYRYALPGLHPTTEMVGGQFPSKIKVFHTGTSQRQLFHTGKDAVPDEEQRFLDAEQGLLEGEKFDPLIHRFTKENRFSATDRFEYKGDFDDVVFVRHLEDLGISRSDLRANYGPILPSEWMKHAHDTAEQYSMKDQPKNMAPSYIGLLPAALQAPSITSHRQGDQKHTQAQTGALPSASASASSSATGAIPPPSPSIPPSSAPPPPPGISEPSSSAGDKRKRHEPEAKGDVVQQRGFAYVPGTTTGGTQPDPPVVQSSPKRARQSAERSKDPLPLHVLESKYGKGPSTDPSSGREKSEETTTSPSQTAPPPAQRKQQNFVLPDGGDDDVDPDSMHPGPDSDADVPADMV